MENNSIIKDSMQDIVAYVVDSASGEIIGKLKTGDVIISQEEIQRRAREKQKRLEREAKRRTTKEKFFFVRSDREFELLSAATLTRLIFLGTYCNYDGVLMVSERQPMLHGDLPKILKLGKTATNDFWNEANPEYITEDANGYLHLNAILFHRGRMKRKQCNPYQQFYHDGVRKLYNVVSSRKHKQLGYIFLLLPFVNREYNLLCHNPYETDIDKVELMSIAEFCERIGYDVTHIDRLLKIYDGILFDVDGRKERFCTITYNGINRCNAKICVNPNIFYIGHEYKAVEILGVFCRE